MARCGLAAAVVDDKVYVVGGHDGESPLKLVEEFEPGPELDSPGTWRQLPPMQARRVYCTASTLNDKVHVIGGSADGRALNTFDLLDVKSGTWDMWFTKPMMQIKRTLHASAAVGNRIFAVGGFDGLRDLTRCEEYDAENNAWRWMPCMDHGRSYFSAATLDGCMYAVGGQDRSSKGERPRAHRSVEKFELYSETWSEVAPLSVGRVGCGTTTLTCEDDLEYLFACGGSDGDATLATMERYDPRKDIWEEAPSMGVQRLGHAVVSVKNRLYAIGGFDGKEPLGTFECYDPLLERWSPPIPMGGTGVEPLPSLPSHLA